ncbi:hypothetical protein ACK3TF_005843 [Chlorella vulgaris]
MDWRAPRQLHPVGFSNHKNEYRRGVCEGNYAEELLAGDARGRPSGYVLDRGGTFSSETTSGAAFKLAPGKAGQELASAAQRQDLFLKPCKYGHSHVPISVNAHSAITQRQQQLEAEAAASRYRTVEKDMIEAAARDPGARAAAKPPLAHPRDVQGEETSVGRKPTGEFSQQFDKDYMRIGLRKP